MSASSELPNRWLAALMVVLCVGACVDKAAETRQQSLAFITAWFAQAANGARDDSHCHGLGLLKHAAVSCAQMLEHAAAVEPTSRQLETITARDCFVDVCGEFVEIRFSSRDHAGNELRENALLKRDDGRFRLYWYRSDSLLEVLRERDPEDSKDPNQVAYDEIVARYPSLYAYPPCYALRVSSSNLAGDLMAKDALNVAHIERLATACGDRFCFALVGTKIAPVCPRL